METLNMEKLVEIQIQLYINRNRKFSPVNQLTASKLNVDVSAQMTETKNDKVDPKR